jgi:hypothetical protein
MKLLDTEYFFNGFACRYHRAALRTRLREQLRSTMQSEGAMPTIEVWVVLGADSNCEVATDEINAIQRWRDEFGGDYEGETPCRVVKLNVTLSDPRYSDDDDETDKAVDVVVPDDAGRIVEVEED